jgi:hypothetical protein
LNFIASSVVTPLLQAHLNSSVAEEDDEGIVRFHLNDPQQNILNNISCAASLPAISRPLAFANHHFQLVFELVYALWGDNEGPQLYKPLCDGAFIEPEYANLVTRRNALNNWLKRSVANSVAADVDKIDEVD